MKNDIVKFAIEAITGGKNTILLDNKKKPSVMVRIPLFYLDEVIDGASHEPHPAFIVKDKILKEIYISKYSNVLIGGLGYSLPGQNPEGKMNLGQSLESCYNKGRGWHLMTNAEWGAVALWAKKNNTLPRGNNNYGRSAEAPHERGVAGEYLENNIIHILTGSGPVTWAHDFTSNGIYDLNGNVWGWVAGLMIKNGEIAVIPNNDAALPYVDHTPQSIEWQSISENGDYLPLGSQNSIKIDAKNKGDSIKEQRYLENNELIFRTEIRNPLYSPDITSEGNYGLIAMPFKKLLTDIEIPTLLKALALFPVDNNIGEDMIWVRNYGIRYPWRGGYWEVGNHSGIFSLNLDFDYDCRGYTPLLGFRSAYIEI
ncbi:MAG: formylglycine-generating enzyme family protein [Actinobacteria bacterium]|nr:formylglycine-generating enzyme family protein [Actinomycetota bacterium]